MRRFLPQTLPAWFLLILIAGLLTTQVSTLLTVERDRRASREILELYRLNDRVLSLVKLMAPTPPDERRQLAGQLTNSALVVDISSQPAVENAIPSDDTFAEMEDIMVDRLDRFDVVDARIRRVSPEDVIAGPQSGALDDAGAVQRGFSRLASGFARTDRLMAAIGFKDGQWLNITMPMTPVGPLLAPTNVIIYLATAAFVVVLSIAALLRLTAPYRTLENAVRRIGRDLNAAPLPERGSREYRSAARAINSMQSQLREYVEDREHLAAALAHDLRTPLTRMRLRLELLDKAPVRDALSHDLGEIDAIARSVIDFATMQFSEEEPELIDLWSLVATLADGYPAVRFAGSEDQPEALTCRARPTGLRRCIANLFDNAVNYGERATVSLVSLEGRALLTIVDEGPGIPEERIAAVTRPFVRVEGSRSRRTGGSGLGLTMAAGFVREAGGALTLENEPGGGLRVAVTLPLA